jgi:hypothetical protein
MYTALFITGVAFKGKFSTLTLLSRKYTPP